MKHSVVLLIFLAGFGPLYAEGQSPEAGIRQKFISGGTVRMHLSAGGYTITPSDSDDIVVTCHARSSEQLSKVKVAIKPAGSSAEVYIEDTPNNNFNATIEVPRKSNLWVRLSAGDLAVEAVEGDKNVEVIAGHMEVEIPHPEEYGHRDASVTMGGLEASAFNISKGGLFRSFQQQGPGKYRLHAHILTGQIDLPGAK